VIVGAEAFFCTEFTRLSRRDHAFGRFSDLGHERVAGRLDRNLVVPADGDFVFAVRASQPRLRLGGTMLISGDGPDNQGIRTFIAPLRQGTYPLSLEFVTATDNPPLYLAVFRCTDDQPEWWTQRPWVELSGR
jgi:hypothetical protein